MVVSVLELRHIREDDEEVMREAKARLAAAMLAARQAGVTQAALVFASRGPAAEEEEEQEEEQEQDQKCRQHVICVRLCMEAVLIWVS